MRNLLLGLFSVISLSALATPSGDLNLSPGSIKLKVYKFAVSTSQYCTNPHTVIDYKADPIEVDFTTAPNMGGGFIPDATYPCVMIEISDQIHFSPSTNSSSLACLTSQTYTQDVCRSGTNSALIDGTPVSCTSGDNHVSMYLALGTNGTGNSFIAPTVGSPNDGMTLSSALVVSGSASGRFVVNASNKLCDATNNTNGDCEGGGASPECLLGPPDFSFH